MTLLDPTERYSSSSITFNIPEGIRTYSSAGDRAYFWLTSKTNSLYFYFSLLLKFVFNKDLPEKLPCDVMFSVKSGNQDFYINLSDFAKKACEVENSSLSPELFANAALLQVLFYETLSPIIGDATTIDTVNEVYKQFRSANVTDLTCASDDQEALSLAIEGIEKLKLERLGVDIIRYDAYDLESRLQPGDILFKRQLAMQDHPVVLGQGLARPLLFSKRVEREAYKYSHAAIYIGDGKIAEAVPHDSGDEIRILNLSDPRFALDSEHEAAYMVARPTDPTLGEEAAEAAKKVAEEVPPADQEQEVTTHRYTKWQALRSLYHPVNFGPYARYHYLKQYEDARHDRPPVEFTDEKNFFCSYLVGYAYQRAESCRVCPQMLGENDAPSEGLVPVIGTPIRREAWALLRRLQHYTEMDEKIKLKFHAKRLTPQDLANYVINNPQLFNYNLAVRKPLS